MSQNVTMTFVRTSPFGMVGHHSRPVACDKTGCDKQATYMHTFTHTAGEQSYFYTCANHSAAKQQIADDHGPF